MVQVAADPTCWRALSGASRECHGGAVHPGRCEALSSGSQRQEAPLGKHCSCISHSAPTPWASDPPLLPLHMGALSPRDRHNPREPLTSAYPIQSRGVCGATQSIILRALCPSLGHSVDLMDCSSLTALLGLSVPLAMGKSLSLCVWELSPSHLINVFSKFLSNCFNSSYTYMGKKNKITVVAKKACLHPKSTPSLPQRQLLSPVCYVCSSRTPPHVHTRMQHARQNGWPPKAEISVYIICFRVLSTEESNWHRCPIAIY